MDSEAVMNSNDASATGRLPDEHPQVTRILVVDDEEVIRTFLTDALTREGYIISTSANGEEALAHLAKQPVDVILTDLAMPGMDGLELLEQTKSLYPDVPKIIITGAGTLDDAIQAIKYGAYDYIKKPLNLGKLGIVLNRAVSNRRLLLSNRDYQRQLQESNQRLEQRVRERTENLKASEEKFRGLFESAIDAIFIVDRQGRYLDWNPSCLEILGYTDEEMTSIHLEETLVEYEKLWPPIEKQLLAGRSVSGFEHRIIRRGGDLLHVENSSTPVLDRSGSIGGFQMILRDITIRKRAEEEIRQINEELIRMNRLKDEFLTHLSHELLTPLAPLKGYLSIIRENLDDPETIEASIDVAQKESARLQQILEALIELSRIMSGAVSLVRSSVDVNRCVESALDQIAETAEKKQIEFVVQLETKIPFVLGESDKIRLIVFNLLSNAVKFTSPNGSVRLETRRVDDEVMICVHDSGIGISTKEIPHIFNVFHQVDGSTRRKQGGIGIGLAMAKRLVDLHGGDIRVESGEGKGSTFIVTLPGHAGEHGG